MYTLNSAYFQRFYLWKINNKSNDVNYSIMKLKGKNGRNKKWLTILHKYLLYFYITVNFFFQ